MEWTKTFDADRYEAALAGWSWLALDGLTPQFTSLFGDIFLSSADGWWYLDTIEGNLTLCWPTREALDLELGTEDGQNRYLLAPLADAAVRERGLILGPDQVYDFMPPPVLGGSFEVANIGVGDFVVSVDIAGQIHQQVRDLPPGARIGKITIE